MGVFKKSWLFCVWNCVKASPTQLFRILNRFGNKIFYFVPFLKKKKNKVNLEEKQGKFGL